MSDMFQIIGKVPCCKQMLKLSMWGGTNIMNLGILFDEVCLLIFMSKNVLLRTKPSSARRLISSCTRPSFSMSYLEEVVGVQVLESVSSRHSPDPVAPPNIP